MVPEEMRLLLNRILKGNVMLICFVRGEWGNVVGGDASFHRANVEEMMIRSAR